MPEFSPIKVALDVVTFIQKTIISIPDRIAEYREEIERLRKLEEERRMEMERQRKLEEERRATPPSYDDGVTQEEFEQIVFKAKKGIRRIKSTIINGFVVSIEVKSQSGISIWEATIDFNDFGHLTGWYSIRSENDDSNIPEAFAREVLEGIRLCKSTNEDPPNARGESS